jgi:DNA-binding transcriptional ArsR family regulator
MYFMYAEVAPGGDPQLLFDALGDATRRRLFERLARSPQTVGALAVEAGISQPAVSQHLRVLREAGLVTDRRDGRRRWYRADPTGLAGLRRYVERYWDNILAAYASGDTASPGGPA